MKETNHGELINVLFVFLTQSNMIDIEKLDNCSCCPLLELVKDHLAKPKDKQMFPCQLTRRVRELMSNNTTCDKTNCQLNKIIKK